VSGWTLSRRAARDLAEIYAYGLGAFGTRAAAEYAETIRHCFELLALNPRMGRSADAAGAGVRRFEHRRHVVFYEIEPAGVRVLAIVHERSVRGIDL
jgi:toxin ParE1/3/4